MAMKAWYIILNLDTISTNVTFSLIASFLIWLNIGGTVAINDLIVGVIGGIFVEVIEKDEQKVIKEQNTISFK
jgi:hypothetical protein